LDSWEGTAEFYDGKTARANLVRAKLTRQSLSFQHDNSSRTFYPHEFRVIRESGGAYLRVSFKNFPDESLIISDSKAGLFVKAHKIYAVSNLSQLGIYLKIVIVLIACILLGYVIYRALLLRIIECNL